MPLHARPIVGFEEISDEVDVATVRDPLESRHLVQSNLLPHEIAVREVLARDLFFAPAVQPIPDPRLLTDIRCHHTGLRDDEVLRFTVARVVLNSKLQVVAGVDVGGGQACLAVPAIRSTLD